MVVAQTGGKKTFPIHVNQQIAPPKMEIAIHMEIVFFLFIFFKISLEVQIIATSFFVRNQILVQNETLPIEMLSYYYIHRKILLIVHKYTYLLTETNLLMHVCECTCACF